MSAERPTYVFVDPGPYAAATVVWRGVALVYVSAGPSPQVAAADDDIIVVKPPKPPIVMKVAVDHLTTLEGDIVDLREAGEEVAVADERFGKGALWHTEDFGTEQRETFLLLVENGNAIDLDDFSSLVQEASDTQRNVVIRFTEKSD